MEEKKDFPILIFALLFFYQVFIELFDLPENAIVYIICSRCPKIACFNQDFMEDMRYEGKKRYSKLGISGNYIN